MLSTGDGDVEPGRAGMGMYRWGRSALMGTGMGMLCPNGAWMGMQGCAHVGAGW